MGPKTFLSFFSVTAGGLGLGILLVNGISLHYKLNLPPRYAQAITLEETAPKTLVLGSSREEYIPTDSLAWPEHLRPVCSIYSPMETISRMHHHLLHALEYSDLQELWLCLDFFTFNTYNQGPPDPSFFLKEPLPQDLKKRWMTLSLFKLKRAIRQMTDILYFQGNCCFWYQTLKSSLGIGPYAQQTEQVEGKRGLEHTLKRLETHTLNEAFFISPPKQFTLEAREGLSPKLEQLRTLLQLCYGNLLTVKVIINPFHARFFELIHAGGLWPFYQEWLKAVVSLVENEAKALGQPPYPILDFSGYSAYNTEAFVFTRAMPTQWYIESSHFNAKLGERIIQRIYQPEGKALEQAGFGVALEAQTIQKHITQLEQGREAYCKAHPEVIAAIQALYEAWKQANHALGIRQSYEAQSAYLQE